MRWGKCIGSQSPNALFFVEHFQRPNRSNDSYRFVGHFTAGQEHLLSVTTVLSGFLAENSLKTIMGSMERRRDVCLIQSLYWKTKNKTLILLSLLKLNLSMATVCRRLPFYRIRNFLSLDGSFNNSTQRKVDCHYNPLYGERRTFPYSLKVWAYA